MSLVNDMLRDLDRRKASDQPTMRDDGSGMAVAPVVVSSRANYVRNYMSNYRVFIWLIVVAGIALGFYFVSGLFNQQQQRIEQQHRLNDQAMALMNPAVKQPQIAPGKPQVAQIERVSVSETETGARMEIQLSQALEHRVIALDTRLIRIELPQAQLSRALPSLTDNWLVQAIDLATQNNGVKLEVYLSADATFQSYLMNRTNQARLVIDFIAARERPRADEALLFESQAESQISAQGGESAIANKRAEEPERQLESPKRAEPKPQPQRAMENDTSEVVVGVQKSAPVISLVEQDHRNSQRALSMARTGEVGAAIDELQLIVQKNPEAKRSRATLAGLLLTQKKLQAAEQLLLDGLAIFPDYAQFTKLLARALVAQKRDGEALNLLHRRTSQWPQDIGLWSLLAPLYQRQEQHSQALQAYQRLLSHDANNGQWLIGHAISLEAIGEKRQALIAYLRARRIPGIDARLIQYASDRIGQLK